MKKKLGAISIVMSSLTYLYLFILINTGTGEGVSLSTYGLWAVLAWIAGISMKKQELDSRIVFVGAVGTTIITVALLFKKRFEWTDMDSAVSALTVLCMILWKTRGSKCAFIFSVLAGAIASIPFVVMTWKDPSKSPIVPNTCFLMTFIVYLFSVNSPKMEDRLVPAVNVIVGLLLVVPAVVWSAFG